MFRLSNEVASLKDLEGKYGQPCRLRPQHGCAEDSAGVVISLIQLAKLNVAEIRCLDLSSIRRIENREDVAGAIASLGPRPTSLRSICLAAHTAHDAVVSVIEQGMKGCFPYMQHLELVSTGLSEAEARHIVDWAELPGASLVSIDLSDNSEIGTAEGTECFVPRVCALLASPSCRLTELSFQDCDVSLQNGLLLLRSLHDNDTLQVLNLNGSAVGLALLHEEDALPVLEALRFGLHQNCSLQELLLCYDGQDHEDPPSFPSLTQTAQIVAEQCLSMRCLGLVEECRSYRPEKYARFCLQGATLSTHHPFMWSVAAAETDDYNTSEMAVTDLITAAWDQAKWTPMEDRTAGSVRSIHVKWATRYLQYDSIWAASPEKAEADPSSLEALKLCMWRLRVATREYIAPFFEGYDKAGKGDRDSPSFQRDAASAIRAALLQCTTCVEACTALGDALTADHILMLSVLTDVILECQEPSRVAFRVGKPDTLSCYNSYCRSRHTDLCEFVPAKSTIPRVGSRLCLSLKEVLLLAERNELDCAAKLRKRWIKLMCLTGRQRRGALVQWRQATRAHADAPLVHRAAREGRPLELAKRLRLGVLAGCLQVREEIAGPGGVRQLGTPLEAARAGGHDECVKLLQYAVRDGVGN